MLSPKMVWVRNLKIPPITISLANYVDMIPSQIRDFHLDEIKVGNLTLFQGFNLREMISNISIQLSPTIQGSIWATYTGDILATDAITLNPNATIQAPSFNLPIDTTFTGSIEIDPMTMGPKRIQGTLSIPLESFLQGAIRPMIMDRYRFFAMGRTCAIRSSIGPITIVDIDPCHDAATFYLNNLQDTVESGIEANFNVLLSGLCLGTVISGFTSISCQGRNPTLHLPINITL